MTVGVTVMWFFLVVPWVGLNGLQYLVVVFNDHTDWVIGRDNLKLV